MLMQIQHNFKRRFISPRQGTKDRDKEWVYPSVAWGSSEFNGGYLQEPRQAMGSHSNRNVHRPAPTKLPHSLRWQNPPPSITVSFWNNCDLEGLTAFIVTWKTISSMSSFMGSKGAIISKGFNTPYIQIFSPSWDFIHVTERTCDTWPLFHIAYIPVVFHHYEFFHDFKANRDKRRINHILYIHRASDQHELIYFSGKNYDSDTTTLVININFV